jgi:hypothetical protein
MTLRQRRPQIKASERLSVDCRLGPALPRQFKTRLGSLGWGVDPTAWDPFTGVREKLSSSSTTVVEAASRSRLAVQVILAGPIGESKKAPSSPGD